MTQAQNPPEPDPPEWTPALVFPVFAQTDPPPITEAPASPATAAAAPEAGRKQALEQATATLRQREQPVRSEAGAGFAEASAPDPIILPQPDRQAAERKTRRALAQVVALFFVSLGITVGLLYWVWFSDMLAPLRLAWLGPSPATNLIFRLLCCFVMGMFLLFSIWLVLLKMLARAVGPSKAQTEQALREGGEQALAASSERNEKMLAEMRAEGRSEEDIADIRQLFEEVQRNAQADHEARVREWTQHPDRLRAHMNEVIREIQAKQEAPGAADTPKSP